MEFYLPLAWTDPAHMLQLAGAAEEAGFDGVAFSDHMIFPKDLQSRYPYAPDGKPHWLPETPYPDPWVAMGYVAAVTTRLRFVTNIFVLPSRDPFVVAKAVGTAAVLSKNRVSVGVGVGWMKEEFDVQGQEFSNRGRRSEEMIDVMRKLWTGEMVSHAGEYYSFPELQMSPMPTEVPPVYLGGYAEAALDRTARIANGWISTRSEVDQIVEDGKVMRGLLDKHDRQEEPFKYFAVCPSLDLDEYRRREEAGVTTIQTQPWTLYANDEAARNRLNWPKNPATLEHRLEGLKRFGEDVIAPLEAAR
jgi:probable F420-dependent oxidoreductase